MESMASRVMGSRPISEKAYQGTWQSRRETPATVPQQGPNRVMSVDLAYVPMYITVHCGCPVSADVAAWLCG